MSHDVRDIPITSILIDDDFNCRGSITHTSIFDLAADIEHNGLLQPVTVRSLSGEEKADHPTKEFALVMGFRRTKACESLQWKTVPAMTADVDIRRAKILNINENLHREDLTFWQECLFIKEFHEMKMTRSQISEEISKPLGWVQRRQNVWRMNKKTQEMVEAGIIGSSHVQKLYSYEDEEELDQVLDRIREKHQSSGTEGTRKINIPKPGVTKRKRTVVPRHRSKADIELLMAYMRDQGLPNTGPWFRVLAWAAGNITDDQLFFAISEFAEELEIPFVIPKNGNMELE